MVAYHFMYYAQPSNLLTLTFSNGRSIDSYIGYALVICVSIFSFINGYGLITSLDTKNNWASKILYLAKKALLFLLEYWFIAFSLFFPFYLTSGGSVTFELIIRTLFGYGGLVGFAWYVWFYLLALILMPLLSLAFNRRFHWVLGLFVAYVPILITVVVLTVVDKNDAWDSIRGYLCYGASVLGGIAFARYSIFQKSRALIARVHLNHWWIFAILSLLLLAVYSILRRAIIAPFAVIPVLFLWISLFEDHKPNKVVMFCFSWLGRLSMPIWFIHYVFFASYVTSQIDLFSFVSTPRIGVFISLFALCMCVPVALVYFYIFKGISLGTRKIFNRRNKVDATVR